MNSETEVIIADILGKEMELATDLVEINETSSNFITIFNQNYVMPKSSGLYIVVGFGFSKIISSNNEVIDDGDTLTEVQSVNALENIVINIMSQDATARQRKSEVIQALSSYYAQQKMEEHNFRIGKIPDSFINISDAEGATTINRYTIVVPIYVWYEKTKIISTGFGADYYSTFENNVIIDNNGEFEFNIGE